MVQACVSRPMKQGIEVVSDKFTKRDNTMVNPKPLGQALRCPHGIGPVTGNALVHGDGNKAGTRQCWQEPGEDHEECSAVFSPA